MQLDLQELHNEIIVKVVVQNDVFDVFTQSHICFRFDLATASLLRSIPFSIPGLGKDLIDVKYFEAKDVYVIISSENFAVGDFVYGYKLINSRSHFVDIRADYLAYANHEGINILKYPSLDTSGFISIAFVQCFSFINEDRELLIITRDINYSVECETKTIKPLTSLTKSYKELRYKRDYLIGITKEGIDFIEEDILEVSHDYPLMNLEKQELSCVKLTENEEYVILGGKQGGVAIFNINSDEVFYRGVLCEGSCIETVNMDIQYQSILLYSPERGIEISPFVDFI